VELALAVQGQVSEQGVLESVLGALVQELGLVSFCDSHTFLVPPNCQKMRPYRVH
jgi:hypothetical protein